MVIFGFTNTFVIHYTRYLTLPYHLGIFLNQVPALMYEHLNLDVVKHPFQKKIFEQRNESESSSYGQDH